MLHDSTLTLRPLSELRTGYTRLSEDAIEQNSPSIDLRTLHGKYGGCWD